MYLKKLLPLFIFIFLAGSSYSQVVNVSPSSATDTACLGDTAFRQIQFINNGNSPLVIDSIIAPAGFGRKGTYPITISDVTTYPFNFVAIDFYHEGSSLGLYTDTFLVYSNAANVPRPFKVPAYMRVVVNPTASFTVNDTDQCRNSNSFIFTNTSTISSGTLSHQWFFGDGTDVTTTNATKTYATPDTFDVFLITTSELNCEAVANKKVIVFPTVSPTINNTNTFVCFKNNAITFDDGSTLSSGTYSRKWFFGDGDSSTAATPTHSYAKDSSFYKVKLITTTDKNCITADSQEMYVYPSPIVGFSSNDSDQCRVGNSFTFTNSTTIKSGSLSYSWNFGDATASTQTNPTKTYASAGNRIVRLIATTDLGCEDTLLKQVFVRNSPTAAFAINDSTQCLVDNFFGLTNTSTVASPDTLTYAWTYGDGGGSTDTNTFRIYNAYGTYVPKLVVTTNFGCKDSISKNAFVYSHPDADFTINDTDQCLNAQNYVFTNTSTIPAGTIAGYSWRFGNGDTSDVVSPTKYDYANHDTLIVNLIARSNQNCYDTAGKEIIIFPIPIIGYTTNDTAQCFAGHQFAFSDTSSVAGGGALTYQWLFGDGANSTAKNPTYTYTNFSSVYSVALNVFTAQGCGVSAAHDVYLYHNPDAQFTILDSAMCFRNNMFNFQNNSSIPSGSYSSFWEFGNTDTTSITSPSYEYATTDTFEVKLTLTSDFGCLDSLTKQTVVYPQPVSKYIVNTQEQCFPGHQFNFRDTSTITSGTLTYFWSFGDATTSTQPTPTKTYATADTFDITHTVTSAFGCDSTITGQVFVQTTPSVGFTVDDSTQCLNGNFFNFTNTSTINAGSLFYNWNLSNGSNPSTANASANYLTTDTFTVTLVASSDKNCVDSLKRRVYVYPNPKANFSVDDPIQCFNDNKFTYTNLSSIEWGTLNFNWDLGDGNTSTLDTIIHTYTADDTFTVKLITISGFGCTDSVIRNSFVNPTPIADFAVDTPAQCINDNLFKFTNSSTISSGSLNYQWFFGDNDGDLITDPSHTYTVADSFEVILIASSDLSCKDTATQWVYVTPSPDPSFTGFLKQYCKDGPAVQLTPVVPGGTFSGDFITANQFNPTNLGWNKVNYYIDLNGCADSTSDSTLVVPVPAIDLGFDTVFCQEDFYTLNATTLGATYLWSDSTTKATNRITTPAMHWVRVSNACGTVYDSVEVKYLDIACDVFMPNAFTPEGNTVNDFFGPYIDTNVVRGIQFLVYSRWGTLVFETDNLYTRGWDGYINGVPAPEGVYAYLLKMTLLREDTRVLKSVKGNFHLLR